MIIRWFGEPTYMEATRTERREIRLCYVWARINMRMSPELARQQIAVLAMYSVLVRYSRC